MPKIHGTNLPIALRQHLFDRLGQRQITVDDLDQLRLRRESDPEAPEARRSKPNPTSLKNKNAPDYHPERNVRRALRVRSLVDVVQKERLQTRNLRKN
jgi:hypothetical protein